MKYNPLLAPSKTKPLAPTTSSFKKILILHMIRNNFSIQTWLLIGAALQALLVLLPIRKLFVIAPTFLFLAWGIVDTLLMTFNFKSHPYMSGVIVGKHAAVPPSAHSTADPNVSPASEEICVILLCMRSNHPLGFLAPGLKNAGEFVGRMNKELEANAVEYNWLGGTNWLNASDRINATELMLVHYFRNYEGLQKFSRGKAHREGWDWYFDFTSAKGGNHKHIAFTHEVYSVPKGRWESIYLNSAQSGLGTTHWPVPAEKSESESKDTNGVMWQSPIVDASRGKLRTSKGRLGTHDGTENEQFGDEPYDAAKIV